MLATLRTANTAATSPAYRKTFASTPRLGAHQMKVCKAMAGTPRAIDLVSDIFSAIPAPDASFDAIPCSEVLGHVPEPTHALDDLLACSNPVASPHSPPTFTRHTITIAADSPRIGMNTIWRNADFALNLSSPEETGTHCCCRKSLAAANRIACHTIAAGLSPTPLRSGYPNSNSNVIDELKIWLVLSGNVWQRKDSVPDKAQQ